MVISQKTVDVPSHLWYPKTCDGRSLFFVCKNEPRKKLRASCTYRFQPGKDMLAWIYGVKSVCGIRKPRSGFLMRRMPFGRADTRVEGRVGGECRDSEHSCMQVQIHRKRFTIKKETEVAVVRVKITLACEECKQRNYNLTKDKKTHPDRMETKKYCKFCKAHTMHKETK